VEVGDGVKRIIHWCFHYYIRKCAFDNDYCTLTCTEKSIIVRSLHETQQLSQNSYWQKGRNKTDEYI